MNTPDGWPEKDVPNDHVADVADQFRDAANLLFREMLRLNCVAPVLVNAALANELYLKALNSKNVYHPLEEVGGGYLITARPQKGHPLTKLYEGLDPEIQDALRGAYGAWKGRWKRPSLMDALGAYDTTFVEERYPFENPEKGAGSSISGLVDLMNFFGDYVNGLRRG